MVHRIKALQTTILYKGTIDGKKLVYYDKCHKTDKTQGLIKAFVSRARVLSDLPRYPSGKHNG